MVYIILICYIIAFSSLIATSYKDSLNKYRLPAKMATSLGFIATATYSAVTSGNMQIYWYMMPAFVFCLIGDALLAINDNGDSKKYFISGLLAFLIGHILFVAAFEMIVPFSMYEFIIPIIAPILTILLLKFEQMDAGTLKKYVLIYSFFVSFLFSKGLCMLYAGITSASILIFVGAALFLVSDTIILFLYFYKKKYYAIPFFNLLTYYAAQFLLALSIMYL